MKQNPTHWRPLVLAVLASAAIVACDNEELMSPAPPVDALFASYVALGNSITAGFQSGGINDSTQRESFANLLAQQMGTGFEIPLLASPGCPPPLVNVFTQERLVPGVACALREDQGPLPGFINNVAVPGAAVIDVFTNLDPASNPNALTTFILGGRTQIEAALDARPTFATVWSGNNDVLGAVLSGDASEVTDPTVFTSRYEAMMDSIDAFGLEGGALIAVVNVTNIPFLSAGAVYFGAQAMGQLPPNPPFNIAANCAPAALGGVGEQALVPFSYGFPKIDSALAGVPVALDCVNDDRVLNPTEVATMIGAVTAYNATITAEAAARGWAFVDINPTLGSLRAAGEIPLFPVSSGPEAVTVPFGPWLSRDGVHPSGAAHQLIAQLLIDAINAAYGTNIPDLR